MDTVDRNGPPCICLDFDGVVHSYVRPWTSPEDIRDPPVPGALEFIADAVNKGYRVVIQSVRANTMLGQLAIRGWLLRHGLDQVDLITITAEKPKALIYIDDRGYRFTGTFPPVEELLSLRPWNRLTPRAKTIPMRDTMPCDPPVEELERRRARELLEDCSCMAGEGGTCPAHAGKGEVGEW